MTTFENYQKKIDAIYQKLQNQKLKKWAFNYWLKVAQELKEKQNQLSIEGASKEWK